ncbi:MAG: hypothetical protein ACPGRG_09885 [Marinomonas sp.]
MINVLAGALRVSRRHADLAAFRGWLCFVVGCLFSFQTQAVSVHASDITPSIDTTPILTVSDSDQVVSLSMSDIESLDLFETDDMTHFDGPKGKFAGVWLNDFLKKYQLDDALRLRLVALDGYEVFLPKEGRERKQYLLVTRLNGLPISASDLGPLMLIIPSDSDLPSHLAESKTFWIWAINDIVAQ